MSGDKKNYDDQLAHTELTYHFIFTINIQRYIDGTWEKIYVEFQHMSILPSRRDENFLGVGGNSLRPKHLKKCMKLKWNF